MKLLSGILKRRAARDEEDKKAKAKLEEAKQKASTQEVDPAVEQHMVSLEQRMNEAFGEYLTADSSQGGFLESVEVIQVVSQLQLPALRLEGTIIEEKVQAALGCMNPGLSFTDEQRYRMIFNFFVESGMVESLIRESGTCPKTLLCTMLDIIGHEEDIIVASQTKNCLERIWKLLYVGKKKPSHLPEAQVKIEIGSLPSFRTLREKLLANGCDMNPAKRSDDPKPSQGYHERMRIHFIRLLLDTVIDFCSFVKGARIHISSEEVDEAFKLFELILCLRYDPNAFRILESLDKVLLSLIGALDDTTWKARLPTISYSLATSFGIDASKALKLRIIRDLPCGFRIFSKRMNYISKRCTELQQYSAAMLLDVIMEPKESRKQPDRRIGTTYPLDVGSFITSQDWFHNPSILVQYPEEKSKVIDHFTCVEMVLRLSNMVLWPYVLTAMNSSKAPINYLNVEFLKRWSSCLGMIQRKIRTLNPEEQAVRTLANFLKLQYDTYCEEYCE